MSVEGKKVRSAGVLYLASVPNQMNTVTVKEYLADFAPQRIFLIRDKRKKSYKEGWVELSTKKKARLAAESLNGQTVGGKKGNPWYGETWSLKYLSNFKWDDIKQNSEQESVAKRQHLVNDISLTRKEAGVFEKYAKLSKQIQSGSKQKSGKQLKYQQIGSENLNNNKVVKKSKKEKVKIRCLKDMPEVLNKLFTGGGFNAV